MNSIIDKGVERYCFIEGDNEDEADEFKKKSQKYITFYNFLLQIYPLKNLNLLRLQVYLVALLKRKGKERVNLDDILSLDYYKLQKLGKDEKQGNDISLSYGDGELVGISENATSRIAENNEEYLDDIIQRINDMFGIGLTEEDRIVIDQYEEMFKADQNIMDIAKANSYEDLVSTFGNGIVRAKNRNDRLMKEILTNNNLQNFMIHYLAEKIYSEANKRI